MARRLRKVWQRLTDPTTSLSTALSYWAAIFTVTIVVIVAVVYFSIGMGGR